jgi:hypothetical protein
MNNELQEDIPDADRLLPLPGVPEWVIFTVFFGLVLVIAIFLIWRRRRAVTAKFRHRGAAYRLAAAALETWQSVTTEIPIQQLAAGISLVLRGYLESATGDPSLFETREELCSRDGALQQLDEATRDELMAFLLALSSLQYGSQSDGNRDELLARASVLLEQARHGLES